MSEKRWSWLLKFLAVVSAVALGAGYVGWKSARAKYEKSEKVEAAVVEDTEELTLIIGSKSPGREMIIIPEDIFYSETAEEKPILLPSSKVGLLPDFGIEITREKIERQEVEQIRVLPGSKSLAPLFDQPKSQEQKP